MSAIETKTLQVEGMTCGSCVGRVERGLRGVPGVVGAAVNLTTGLASVTLEIRNSKFEIRNGERDADGNDRALVGAVERAGYSAVVLGGSSAEALRGVAARGASREAAIFLEVVFGIAMAVLMFGMEGVFKILAKSGGGDETTGTMTGGIECLLATAVMFGTGRRYFVGGYRALRHFSANMDLLVAIGAGTAYVASALSVVAEMMRLCGFGGFWSHVPHVHEWHAAVVIVVLVSVGKYLEARAKKRAGAAVGALAEATAATATVVREGGKLETVSAEEVKVGDLVQVVAHQVAAVDGEVVEGAGSLDKSVVTGESVPVELGLGDIVPGGAMLVDGRVVLRATSTAGSSAVARIVGLVQQAQASRTKIQGLSDRVAGIFVPIVIAVAATTFAGWMYVNGQVGHALATAIATVVIACPCAMGLATPTAITVAVGRGAKMGLLFTQATALETARDIDAVLFDKTGTLTKGQLRVVEVVPAGNAGEVTPQARVEILQMAAALEQFSEHPLAQAIVKRAREEGLDIVMPVEFGSVAGGGVRGKFEIRPPPLTKFETEEPAARSKEQGGGKLVEVLVGSGRWVEGMGVGLGGVRPEMDRLQSEGMTVVVVAVGGNVAGAIGLRDELREGARGAIEMLRRDGVKVGVVSGDAEAAVWGVLKGIEVDWVYAGVRPEEKAAIVERVRKGEGEDRARRVAFVGDGVNDGPALAAADLGIAMSTGTEVAKAAGDVVMVSGKLEGVAGALGLARATLRVIRQNLFWAFAYNVAAIPLAVLGILPAGVAAGAMMLSSLTVVANALRLNWVGGRGG